MTPIDYRARVIDPRWTVKATYIIAVILVICWAAGFLIFHMGPPIHVLLMLSMMAILINVIRES
jgi:hypothetical protein